MSSQSKYIIIDESRNLDEGTVTQQGTTRDIHDTNEAASQKMLGDQGIIIEVTQRPTETTNPTEEISREFQELLGEGGIEIVPNEGSTEED